MKKKAYYADLGEQQKNKRRPRSFVRRITFRQIVRLLFTMLLIDLLIVAFAMVTVLIRSEQTAAKLIELPVEQALEQTSILTPDLTVSLYYGEPNGWRMERYIPARYRVFEDSARDFSWSGDWNQYFGKQWDIESIYTIYMPTDRTGEYLAVAFDLVPWIQLLRTGMNLLVCAELVILFFSIFGIQSSVRKTLAPIQQLTQVTRNFSNEPPIPAKEQPELELDNTIHTLNSITAKKLDTRISVDEQPELMGLAGAINSMLDRLDAAYQSQLRFVSDASHELRTPIAVIQGYANLLDRWGKEDPAALQESIDAIKAETSGMQGLVEQLLFLARSDNNSIVLNLDTFDSSALASEVMRDTQVIDQTHQLASDIEPGLWVMGDAGLLKQALRIFMDNALKYTPADQRITLSAKREDDRVLISVTDNGIGIPESDLPHVFERFYRSDESRARKTGGTGLGLAIAKWTVQRHGGHMDIISRKDIGTRLTMNLPAAQAKTEELPQAQ